MRDHSLALLLMVLGICLSCPAAAQVVTFDFDTGTPALLIGQGLPLDQTSLGVTAHFSSPLGTGFSVQTDASTTYRLSQFSGRYLWPNGLDTRSLDIQFSQQFTGITLTFATTDFQQVEVPTTVQLTATLASTGAIVGSTTAHGTYAGDTMPMGMLSLASTAPFDVVRLEIPYQAQPAAGFLVDNIVVTLAPVTAPRKPRKHLHRLTG